MREAAAAAVGPLSAYEQVGVPVREAADAVGQLSAYEDAGGLMREACTAAVCQQSEYYAGVPVRKAAEGRRSANAVMGVPMREARCAAVGQRSADDNRGQVREAEADTLQLFGRFYREDVLKNPSGDDHGNIRNFMKSGWDGVAFPDGLALKKK